MKILLYLSYLLLLIPTVHLITSISLIILLMHHIKSYSNNNFLPGINEMFLFLILKHSWDHPLTFVSPFSVEVTKEDRPELQKKTYKWNTKEEAKQAFKELLKEKVSQVVKRGLDKPHKRWCFLCQPAAHALTI